MDLTPGILNSWPRVTLGLLALILSQLIRVAHPHERAWNFVSGFMLGFAVAMLISALVDRYRKRV